MIDLHSHILPGLDDGARDLREAVAIARTAVADGTRVIAATPHVRNDFPTSAVELQRGVAELRNALTDADVRLEVLPGAEIALDRVSSMGLDDLREFGLAGNRHYVLVETPYYGWPPNLQTSLTTLRSQGMTPVVAHPERNAEVQNRPELLRPIVEAGALVQITAASLDGRLGRVARACAWQLLQLELTHLLASDAHSPTLRAVGLSSARAEIGDEELGAWLTEGVPGAIVSGSPIPPRPASRLHTA